MTEFVNHPLLLGTALRLLDGLYCNCNIKVQLAQTLQSSSESSALMSLVLLRMRDLPSSSSSSAASALSAFLVRFLEGVAAGALFLPLGVALGLAGVSALLPVSRSSWCFGSYKLTGCSGKSVAVDVSEKLLLDDT